MRTEEDALRLEVMRGVIIGCMTIEDAHDLLLEAAQATRVGVPIKFIIEAVKDTYQTKTKEGKI